MSDEFLQIVLFQLFMIILLAEAAKIVCDRIRIPSVVGEILVGVVIANTFLYTMMNIDSDMEVLQVLSELGVIFLLFTVGLETPFSAIRKVGSTAILVAVLGVILPFVAGYGLMIYNGVGVAEAMFVGAAMVATSVGITARVIKDMDLTHTVESRVIIGAAVIDDILGMIILAIVVGIAGGGTLDIIQVAIVAVEAVLFVLAIIFIGSMVLPKAMKMRDEKRKNRSETDCAVERKRRKFGPLPLALIICFALSSMSAFIGLAAIIGAFLAGMAFAEFKDQWPCEEKMEPITEFLTPFFFVFVGINVVIADFADMTILILAIVITVLAVITKFIGCGLGSRKLGGKSATIIGIGMVPRGEVGLIVASIGLTMGVVESGLYNAIVFMSIITTLIVPPLLGSAFRRKLESAAACEKR